jgi:hypothetical protein
MNGMPAAVNSSARRGEAEARTRGTGNDTLGDEIMIAVQRVLPGMLADIIRRQPLSAAKVEFAWRTSVGPALARATAVHLGPDGTLIVQLTDSRWSPELNRRRTLLRERLDPLLGEALQRIVILSPQHTN